MTDLITFRCTTDGADSFDDRRLAILDWITKSPNQSPDPVRPNTWWLCGDEDQLARAIKTRQADPDGEEPYVPRISVYSDKVVVRFGVYPDCEEQVRKFVQFLIDLGPWRAFDEYNIEFEATMENIEPSI